jgi:uncharacterized protein (TIGR02599 family)
MDNKARRSGFTIVELLVATAVLMLLMALLLSALNSSMTIWTRGASKIQSFQQARAAYEAMTRKISQATLNIYWDYDTNSSGNPIGYKRQSELQFLTGPATNLLSGAANTRTHAVFFLAPLGYSTNTNQALLQSLLNAGGYYLSFGPDSAPAPLTANYAKSRFRLMEIWQPSENLGIYSTNQPSGTLPPANPWYSTNDSSMLAENIIALIIRPRLPQREDPNGNALVTSSFTYNSRATNSFSATDSSGKVTTGNTLHQLPPVVQVTMVAIDERSALRNENGTSMPDYGVTNFSQLFTTPANFQQDLRTLENGLISKNITYQIFDTLVPLESAKWSR